MKAIHFAGSILLKKMCQKEMADDGACTVGPEPCEPQRPFVFAYFVKESTLTRPLLHDRTGIRSTGALSQKGLPSVELADLASAVIVK
jgi:hypothetical protein